MLCLEVWSLTQRFYEFKDSISQKMTDSVLLDETSLLDIEVKILSVLGPFRFLCPSAASPGVFIVRYVRLHPNSDSGRKSLTEVGRQQLQDKLVPAATAAGPSQTQLSGLK